MENPELSTLGGASVPGSIPWAVERLTSALGAALDPAVATALEFAHRAHAGQTRRSRRGPPPPYFIHPVEVAVLVVRWAGAVEASLPPLPILLTAAVLHDTVEDCSISVDDLETQFGIAVTQLVLALSKPRLREKETNEERAGRFTRQIAAAGHAAVFLKCCDLMHNLAGLDTTPATVLEKAVQRGTTHYVMLLEEVPLGESFRTAVRQALDRGKVALSDIESDAAIQPLNRILARSGASKTDVHDAIQMLQEIDGSGRAMIVKYPRHGNAVVIAGDIRVCLDAGRFEAIRSAIREQGGAARIRSSLLRNVADPSGVAAFGCLDRGFDGTDTVLIWLLPDERMAVARDTTPPEVILRLVLTAVMKSSAELCRDLALEAMQHGLQLDLRAAYELGVERGQLGQLVCWRSTCEQACRMIEAEIREFLHVQGKKGSLWHRVRIEHRVKTCASILAKFRNSPGVAWPEFASLQDIAGVRVICPTEWHTNCLVSFLEESKGERPLDGPIKRYDLKPTVHGYRGVHAVRLVLVPVEPSLIPCEVQIRTLIQDAWSTLSHAVAYKVVGKACAKQRATLRALAIALAKCDKAATDIFGELDRTRRSHVDARRRMRADRDESSGA